MRRQTLWWERDTPLELPDNSTKQFFLKVGYQLDLFKDGIFINADVEIQKGYQSNNAVRILAIVSDYLGNPERIEEKEAFLSSFRINDTGKVENKGEILRLLADKVYEAWLSKYNNEYARNKITLYNNKIQNKSAIEVKDLPVIPSQLHPRWFMQNIGGKRLHEFLEESDDSISVK
jgi:predicted methyltransferase MtxX (methanogen marker protein 4)